MKNMRYFALLFVIPMLGSERQPLLSTKLTKKESVDTKNIKMFLNIKNKTAQTLKIFVNNEIQCISKPGKAQLKTDIPLSFKNNSNEVFGSQEVIIADADKKELARFACVLDYTKDKIEKNIRINFFVQVTGKPNAHLETHFQAPKSSYNVTAILIGKNTLEKIEFKITK